MVRPPASRRQHRSRGSHPGRSRAGARATGQMPSSAGAKWPVNGGAGLQCGGSRGGAVSPAPTCGAGVWRSGFPGSQGRGSVGVALTARRAAGARSQNETPIAGWLLGAVLLLANFGAGWGRSRPPGTAPGAPGAAGFGVAWMVLVIEADPRGSRAAVGLRREAGVWRMRFGRTRECSLPLPTHVGCEGRGGRRCR